MSYPPTAIVANADISVMATIATPLMSALEAPA
jgi:hypothetical protein